MPEIIDALEAYGMSVECKSLCSVIEMLRQYEMNIIGTQEDRTCYYYYYYYVGNRQLELAELKLSLILCSLQSFLQLRNQKN